MFTLEVELNKTCCQTAPEHWRAYSCHAETTISCTKRTRLGNKPPFQRRVSTIGYGSRGTATGDAAVFLACTCTPSYGWTCLCYRFCNKHLPSSHHPIFFCLVSHSTSNHIQRLMLQSVPYRICNVVLSRMALCVLLFCLIAYFILIFLSIFFFNISVTIKQLLIYVYGLLYSYFMKVKIGST